MKNQEMPDFQSLPLTAREAGTGPKVLPGRAQYRLPFKEEIMVSNYLELPLSLLLTDSIVPWLQKRIPNNRFAIGQNSFIYYRLEDPVEEKGKAPDWFCMLDVPPTLDGDLRLSYVLWEELVPPTIVLELLSDHKGEEYDRTPRTGKFWAYEQAIRAPYYGIFHPKRTSLEVYALVAGSYQQLTPNQQGRYLIEPLELELGIWNGEYFGAKRGWLRWWDAKRGTMLLTGREEAEAATRRADEAKQHADEAEQRADEAEHHADEAKRQADEAKQQKEKLAEKLRSLGIDPDNI